MKRRNFIKKAVLSFLAAKTMTPEKARAISNEMSMPKKIRKGGIVPGLGSGGIVPGVGNSDVIPAFLEPGEFIIPRDAAIKYGFK